MSKQEDGKMYYGMIELDFVVFKLVEKFNLLLKIWLNCFVSVLFFMF